MGKSFRHSYEFGPFCLDPSERLLLREGREVLLARKDFDMLVALVERAGRLAAKDELLREVWAEAIVEPNSLDKSVSAIRKALGAEGPRLITTVRGHGYRFADEVREVVDGGEELLVLEERSRTSIVIEETEEEEASEERGVGVARQPVAVVRPQRQSLPAVTRTIVDASPKVAVVTKHLTKGRVAAVAAGLLILWLGGAALRRENPRAKVLPPLKAVPLTSSPGTEVDSALSPDGRMVAFSWQNPRDGGGIHIYVRQTDTGEPLRITTHPKRSPDPIRSGSPAWSPDGRHIAFVRISPFESDCGVFVVAALGGPERKVHSFRSAVLSNSGLDWSPDGKTLLFAERDSAVEPFGLSLLSLDTLETRKLTHPPAGHDGDARPVFSPDGQTIAFSREATDASDLHIVSVAGGEPARLTFDSGRVSGSAWTPDGRHIVFDSNRSGAGYALWKIPASGGETEPLGVENAVDPSLSRQGNRLTFTQYAQDTNVWRYGLTGDEEAAAAAAAPAQLFPSTRRDGAAHLSTDGTRVVFVSNRSGNYEIWSGQSDGSDAIQLTTFGGAFTTGPRWSPDGARVAFESHGAAGRSADIYVVGAQGGAPRRLTEGGHNNVRPSWSRDGSFVYFASNRGGSWQVWKTPADGGGEAAQVTRGGGYETQASPDGRELFYTKRDTSGLFRAPAVGGGEEVALLPDIPLGLWETRGAWTVTSRGIYFVDGIDGEGHAVKLFDPSTGEVTRVLALGKNHSEDVGLNVSPDGRWLILTRVDYSNHDIMLVENFF